jgi:leucyl aminopeptidase (aminopeptidase T)
MAPTAKNIIEQVLAVKPGERVCIFTDTQCPQSITQLLAANTQAAGAETVIVTIVPKEVGGIDPPPSAVAAIQAANVVIAQASYAIVHTETVRNALKSGARVCEMWGFNEDMMVRGGATADYGEIEELSQRLVKILTAGKEARLTTPDGSDFTMSLADRPAHVLAGTATEPGRFCAFPDGEAAISPLEGSAQGILVNPFCLEKQGLGFIKEDISLEVAGGKVAEIKGGSIANQLLAFLNQIGKGDEKGLGNRTYCPGRQQEPGRKGREPLSHGHDIPGADAGGRRPDYPQKWSGFYLEAVRILHQVRNQVIV